MTTNMDDDGITTLDQIRRVLEGSQGIEFKGVGREERYRWIEKVVQRFDYFELGRKDKGLVKAYVRRLSGFSRAQVTRLIARKLKVGTIRLLKGLRNSFTATYTTADKELLAQTDNAHGRLSGPATKKILERQYGVYGEKRFIRLQAISAAHVYRLRQSRAYQQSAHTFSKTRSVQVAIGIRRRPDPQGRPGYLRVDTVHQGDLNGQKGVYHINLVDAVTQWEIVACVETISEAHLEPIIEEALLAFPFVILGFHSDNGGEYINGVIAKLLNKLLVEQTKSRSGRTNDNALVEGKNGSVIRKHMGYWHIEQKHAPQINRFYREHFNEYLNFHRPCGFATVTIDEKGRRHKKYETYQTPYECLKALIEAARSKPSESDKYLRADVSLGILDAIAARKTDNESAAAMSAARDKLLRKLAGGGPRALPAAAVGRGGRI
jgi:transposase InsO family protein